MPPKRSHDAEVGPTAGVYVSAVPLNSISRIQSESRENIVARQPVENPATLALLQRHKSFGSPQNHIQNRAYVSKSPATPKRIGANSESGSGSTPMMGAAGMVTPRSLHMTFSASNSAMSATPGSSGGVRSRRKPVTPSSAFSHGGSINMMGLGGVNDGHDLNNDNDIGEGFDLPNPPRARDAGHGLRNSSQPEKSIFDLDAVSESDHEDYATSENASESADSFSFGGVRLKHSSISVANEPKISSTAATPSSSPSLGRMLGSTLNSGSHAVNTVISGNAMGHLRPASSSFGDVNPTVSFLDPKAIAVLFRDIADGFDGGVVSMDPSAAHNQRMCISSSAPSSSASSAAFASDSEVHTSTKRRRNSQRGLYNEANVTDELSGTTFSMDTQSPAHLDSASSLTSDGSVIEIQCPETPATASVLMTLSNEIREAVRLMPPTGAKDPHRLVANIESSKAVLPHDEIDVNLPPANELRIDQTIAVIPNGEKSVSAPNIPSLTVDHRVSLNRETFIVPSKAKSKGKNTRVNLSDKNADVASYDDQEPMYDGNNEENSSSENANETNVIGSSGRVQDLQLAPHDDFLAEYVRIASETGSSETARGLRGQYRLRFDAWRSSMAHGYHLMLHGLGSKKNLLQSFVQSHLSDGPVVQIYGYNATVSMRRVLTELDDVVLEPSAANTRYIAHALEGHARRIASLKEKINGAEIDAERLLNLPDDPSYASALSVLIHYQNEVAERIQEIRSSQVNQSATQHVDCALSSVDSKPEDYMTSILGVRRGRSSRSAKSPAASPTSSGKKVRCDLSEAMTTEGDSKQLGSLSTMSSISPASSLGSAGRRTTRSMANSANVGIDATVSLSKIEFQKMNEIQDGQTNTLDDITLEPALEAKILSIKAKLLKSQKLISAAVTCPSGDIEDGPAAHSALDGQTPPFVYIVVHSLDGPSLRRAQNASVISRLAQIPGIRIIASVDHQATRLLWNDIALSRNLGSSIGTSDSMPVSVNPPLKWLYDHVPTFETYAKELAGVDTSVVLLNSSAVESRQDTLRHTLGSLTRNHKALLALLANHQVSLLENADEQKSHGRGRKKSSSSKAKSDSKGEEGMPVNDWLEAAWDDMLVASDEGFKKLVRELEEQGLVQFNRILAKYFIPYSVESIRTQILQP